VFVSQLLIRKLGLQISNQFGPGSGDIMLRDVNCRGNETSLADCERFHWGNHSCEYDNYVSILCVDNFVVTGVE